MRRIKNIYNAFCLATLFFASCGNKSHLTIDNYPKSRIIVLTDILNEPDDSQTLVRLLMYSNEVDIEGLIAVSSCHQYKGKNDPNPDRNTVHPDEIKKYVKAYGKVRENLMKHIDGWPTTDYLLSVTGAGPEGFGTRDIGPGLSTSGSAIVCNAIKKQDERPLYVIINGGANCLAQALIDLGQEISRDELDELLKNVRVCDNAGQDNAGAWIAYNFPDLHYKRSSHQVYNFMNQTGPAVWDTTFYPGKAQHLWAAEHIQNNHGVLGAIYPTRMRWKDPTTFSTIEGGGSGNFIGFANRGLYHPEHIEWGGWGGRFKTEKEKNIYANQLKWAEKDLFYSEDEFKPYFMFPEASDNWTDPITGKEYNGIGVPIFRWRRAYQNDFRARMDWCVDDFQTANHNPVAAVNGDKSDGIVYLNAIAGSMVKLDASDSADPDGDELSFRWFYYPEAGTYQGSVQLIRHDNANVKILVPEDAGGKQIHIILEVEDKHPEVPLTAYRRVIIKANNK
ncbi:nucleoside hydrolase-like domain-containing protein [Draconibacterium orientale]|uniref:nucleoside hydrolase-like domain-containing protein n=1 Tax=Draconibacterium orientale TaxID=1168034 RepID=UPI002ABDCCB7|nr:nucleoside hydrolase-like domain-containing protein [Draconibacterium orientale]